MSEALELYNLGYRQISRKFGMVSRIDRDDWREVMAATHLGGIKWVNGMGDESAADYYRRVLSEDKIEGVDEEIMYELRKLVKERGM